MPLYVNRKESLKYAKRKCIVKEFAALHHNSPEIPMVSWLDIKGIPAGL